MQKLPALTIQPYLHLPIRRSSLVHFMLVKSVWSPFNLWHFILLVPFMAEVFENLPYLQALGWSVSMGVLILSMNFLLLFLKRSSEVDTRIYLGMLASLVALIGLHWFDVVDFNAISNLLFDALFLHPWTMIIPALLLLGGYWMNFRFSTFSL